MKQQHHQKAKMNKTTYLDLDHVLVHLLNVADLENAVILAHILDHEVVEWTEDDIVAETDRDHREEMDVDIEADRIRAIDLVVDHRVDMEVEIVMVDIEEEEDAMAVMVVVEDDVVAMAVVVEEDDLMKSRSDFIVANGVFIVEKWDIGREIVPIWMEEGDAFIVERMVIWHDHVRRNREGILDIEAEDTVEWSWVLLVASDCVYYSVIHTTTFLESWLCGRLGPWSLVLALGEWELVKKMLLVFWLFWLWLCQMWVWLQITFVFCGE